MLLANKCIGSVAYMGGVPAVLEDFCWSWGQMIQINSELLCNIGEYVYYNRAKASFHSMARNSLVDAMQGDWLLMFDTDHAFEPDICVRMVHRMNKYDIDVLSGVYTYKMPPFAPLLFKEEEDQFRVIGKWEGGVDLYPMDSAGAGCLLVKRSVFDKIRKELKQSPFDIEYPFGEDHSFFRRCKKLGINTWFDPRIECHHLAVVRRNVSELEGCVFNEKQKVKGMLHI
jgi:Glycosyl transferase family 2